MLLLQTGWLLAQSGATVTGTIRTTTGEGFGGINVEFTETATGAIFSDIHYQSGFSAQLPLGGDFTIAPYQDDNPLNGVTTFDAILIVRHILGIQPFTSPYQYIAADVDGNGVVELADTTEMRKLILGIYTELPNNSSWRFVPRSYVFPNPANPFPFPEVIATGPLSGDLSGLDFIAIKIGDVNGTAVVDGGGGNGGFYNSSIRGQVQLDQNANCLNDSGESPLAGWIVTARDGVNEYFASTRHDGAYTLYAPDGTYDVWLNAPNALWNTCDTINGVQVEFAQIDTVNFVGGVAMECPLMEVQLSTSLLRRCFSNSYKIEYCNKGTATAEDAQVVVTFDEHFIGISSSQPWSAVDGQTYTFDLGDVPAGFCGTITVYFTLSCDAEIGETHCTTANIYPDSLCGPLAWNGGDLEITGECQGDNVVFTIINHGAPMTQAVDYVVIEDVMVQLVSNGSIQLGTDETQTITLPANGSTWRLEVAQPQGYPWGNIASAAIEGCGENGSGSFSLGFINLFANNDGSPFADEDCVENIGSFDPNDKRGLPLGVQDEHFIPKDQEIEYLIRFQNTGTDTAFTVIVLDTLSKDLNPATMRPIGSSHAYSWQVLGEGVLQFVFNNILLPDSNVNEAASHGYIKFAIKPRPNLPDPTRVENQAAIFFDFNAAVITNRTWHTFGEHYLNVSNVTFRPDLSLQVWPNPTSTEATFFLKSPQPLQGRLRVFDALGREVGGQDFTENQFQWNASALMPGLYYFRLEGKNGEGLAAGSLTVLR